MFKSYFLGGFECSCHYVPAGTRMNMTTATGHGRFARQDYARLQSLGLRAARDGVAWPAIEGRPGRYDFTSALPMLRAARATGTQVIWDLCHYGWPDDLDIFAPQFVDRFARFARAFARLLADESDEVPFYAPMNEISFFAWAGAAEGTMNPFVQARGDQLKDQLVRAAVAGAAAVREVDPRARLIWPEPAINVIPDPEKPDRRSAAVGHTASQYDAWDMLAGRRKPELGGSPEYLDIIGVNYYPHNQWVHKKWLVRPRHPSYRPLRELLGEIYDRYGRPMFIAETGTEGTRRPGWLRYVGREVRAAVQAGVPVHGITIYPILDYPGWGDERHCYTGVWGYAGSAGRRPVYEPLAREVTRQVAIFRDCEPDAAPPGDLARRLALPPGRWRHLGFIGQRRPDHSPISKQVAVA